MAASTADLSMLLILFSGKGGILGYIEERWGNTILNQYGFIQFNRARRDENQASKRYHMRPSRES
ncbi:hypothetical protein HCH_01898 [Hahella chejuensis KCTC 2396]|uniref:Uncharacterized protein n=1 Tax=Hahella chejuensis (strain KCTC 2396) TaxID=349521 RepID=Q2SKU1_HAHCH|nr:hypothetical protein HCH_01898 [Hahella chejuensis KCTC 2396]